MLLYAKTQEEIDPDGQIKRKDGNFIYFRTLDLNTDFDAIKERLDSFVN
jgi:5-methylcytosine-specific restriction enzyme subunit McrC